MTHLVIAILTLAAVHSGPPQGQAAPATLADFVQNMQWNPAKRGPLMVLEPETVHAKKGLDGLAAFGRMRTSMTGLSAIVPDTMVIIDDSMQQPPNMYDGLPRNSKVLYLMSTLDAGQWQAITGRGLGMADLSKDQKAVFTSLLPRPFTYDNFEVKSNGFPDMTQRNIEVSDSDLVSIRLRVDRNLQFMLPMVGRVNGLTPGDTLSYFGKTGAKFSARDAGQEFNPQESYAIKIRQTEPNQQKPSDLDYRASILAVSVSLKPSEKISDLLKRVGGKTGLQLYADLRVGGRSMVSVGGSAPAASLLRAIALSVTGTYRRVGGAYILTSDLVGIGTRKLQLAAYDQELNRKVQGEEMQWRQQIGMSGHLKDIKFRDDDDLAPGDALLAKMDAGYNTKITSSDLTENLRQFIQRQNQIDKTQEVTADGASVFSEINFSFVLPSGDPTRAELASLGQAAMFNPNPGRPHNNLLSQRPKLSAAEVKVSLSICLRADTADAARHAVGYAARFGLHDLWLDTLSPDALNAAVKDATGLSVKVSLAVRPLDYRGAADAPSADRTILGDTPPESMRRRLIRTVDFERAEMWPGGAEVLGAISPLSVGFKTRVDRVADLAKMPGLAGIRVLNPTPNGYNGPRVDYIGIPSPVFLEMGNFGYAEDLRLAFIRSESIDPIDLGLENVSTNSDLRQPFFLDDALRGRNSIYDGTDQTNPEMRHLLNDFDVWLAKLNHSALQSLLDRISQASPQLSILVDAIPLGMNAINRTNRGLGPWKPGDPLPELAEGPLPGPGQPSLIQHMTVTSGNIDSMSKAMSYLGRQSLSQLREMGIGGLAIDLESLTPAEIDRFLSGAFVASK